ncbi:MAG TPA: lipid A deacylase LpxR family protein [Mucilaginibacter sp.]
MTIKTLITASLLMTAIGMSAVKKTYAQDYKNQITLQEDNDMYINSDFDRYYTAGTILTFTHAMLKPDSSSKLAKKIMEYQFGQQIYNPKTAHVKNISQLDRPFTAYLFAGVSMNLLYKNEDALKLTAQLGTIGPNALGRQIQAGFHKLFGLYPAGPWETYQLNNEFGININADYRKLLYRTAGSWFDLAFNPEVRLGNTFTYANVGLPFRLGKFGRFYESAITNSRVSSSSSGASKYELYFFAEPEVSYVAYNATIQGGLFRSDKGPYTFGIRHFLYIQTLGVQFTSARWSLSYTAYIRGREVKSTAGIDPYGSVGITYRFTKI